MKAEIKEPLHCEAWERLTGNVACAEVWLQFYPAER